LQAEDADKWDNINGIDALETEQATELFSLLHEYDSSFKNLSGESLLQTFTMDTGDAQPISLYPYRVPIKWKQKIEDEIEALLDNHIIRRSTSPWSSPIVPVPKPDNSVRMCIDYRAVNKVTVVQR
jgi:hypothetical protein